MVSSSLFGPHGNFCRFQVLSLKINRGFCPGDQSAVTAEVASIECVAAKGNAPVAGTPRQSKRNCVRWIKRWSCYYFLHETSDEITTEAPNFACQLVGITSNF
jgi:hypothetical protein